MDPSTPSAPNAQDQQVSDQPVNNSQPASSTGQPTQPTQPAQTQQPKIQISSVPGSIEEGSAVIMQGNPDAREDDEEEMRVAPQEMKNQAVSQQGGSDVEEESAEVQPSVPEFAASPEVEKIVEKAPPEEPTLTPEVKKAGVTHSGPGVIDMSDTKFAMDKIPVSFDAAVVEEKETELHDSKHWLMGKIVYIWRKLNPNITVKKAPAKKVVPVKPTQVPPVKAQ